MDRRCSLYTFSYEGVKSGENGDHFRSTLEGEDKSTVLLEVSAILTSAALSLFTPAFSHAGLFQV